MNKMPEVATLERALEQYLAINPAIAEALLRAAEASLLASALWLPSEPPALGSRVVSAGSTNLKTEDIIS